jgi:leucyl aminopeptidase
MAARTKSTRQDKSSDQPKNQVKPQASSAFHGLSLGGFFPGGSERRTGGKKSEVHGRVLYFGVGTDSTPHLEALNLPHWALERARRKKGDVYLAPAHEGPVWLVQPRTPPQGMVYGGVDGSSYGTARDLAGSLAGALLDFAVDDLEVTFVEATEEEKLGFFVGLELGAYRFKTAFSGKTPKLPRLHCHDAVHGRERAVRLGTAVNLARHLVNLPANALNPATFAAGVVELFRRSKHTTVEIWTGDKLVKERMGLLCAVGGGAKHGPALLHISYRGSNRGPAKTQAKGAPKKNKAAPPVAFVGKGITFDSGGLNIKDAGSMRLMKKDMGGAASVTALAWWLDQSGLAVDCDFYLALAENAIDKNSFRPGDIIQSRQGLTVEIDNTDAEGRLVLADALDVAISGGGGEVPEVVIDLATLTGAMRVALGTKVGGMFATDEALVRDLSESWQLRADPMWRMPLVPEYGAHLKSTVADMANSGPSRFGGAISAAIFLQRFVGQVPWAHFDIYCWSEGNGGGCSESGGNGQAVQLLTAFLEKRAGG